MKNLIMVIVATLSVSLIKAQEPTDYFDFSDNDNQFSLGVGLSSNNQVSGSIGIINICGFYIDFYGNSEGNHRSNVGIEKYSGYDVGSWHIGYTIPITHRIAITPILGKLNWEKGYYDGANWGIDEDGIVNEWVCTESFTAFDFGANIRYDAYESDNFELSVFFAGTKYSYSFGIEFALSFDNFVSY